MDCGEETPLVEDKTTLKRRRKMKPPTKQQIPFVNMEVEDEKEDPDALILLIKKTIDTIMLEEAVETGRTWISTEASCLGAF